MIKHVFTPRRDNWGFKEFPTYDGVSRACHFDMTYNKPNHTCIQSAFDNLIYKLSNTF